MAGLVYEPLLKWLHDRRRDRQPVPPDQGVALAGKVAVVLIFQPRGLARSLLLTLRYLVSCGYAPLVVSNAPLTDGSRAALAPLTWRIVERPNFGYDFGGYRDGILLLRRWGDAPERLIVMNDSIWMPLGETSDLVARLEAAEGDVVGGFLHPDTIRARTGTLRRGFVESYLYLINAQALAAPGFWRFWTRFRVSSNKLNAIYRGERGFSQAMQDAGLSVTGIFTPAGLIERLRDVDPATLRRVLHYAAYTEPDLRAESKALLAATETTADWRAAVLDHIARTARRRRFNASFPFAAARLMGMDFLKKSAGPTGAGEANLHSAMRRQYLAAVRAGDLPAPFPEVRAEIEARDRLDPATAT